MEREKKIIDASVVFKWFSEEENTDKALILKDKHVQKEVLLIIPDLLFLEITNALKFKKNNSEKIKKSNEYLWNFQFKVKRLDKNVIDIAINIALENNFTIYDSVYIALAQIHGCELITADEKLIKMKNVRLLKDIEV